MGKHSLVEPRRIQRHRAAAGTAILVTVAAVAIGAFTSGGAVSAADPRGTAASTPAALDSSESPRPVLATPNQAPDGPVPTAPIALLETSSVPIETSAGPPAVEVPNTPPASAPAPTPQPAPAEQPGAPTPHTAPNTTPPGGSDPPSTASPATTQSAEALITGRDMFATEPVNVRSAPGTRGTTVLVTLKPREQVLAGSSIDGWVPVHAGAVFGWVAARHLKDGVPPAAERTRTAGSSGNWMTDLLPRVDPNGVASWVFARNGGWGASDGHTNYIDPNVPIDKRFSVMVHEYSHVMQVRVYGSLHQSVAAMSAITGAHPADVSANEKTADCMALMLGASWIHYGCPDSLRGAASAILAGHRP